MAQDPKTQEEMNSFSFAGRDLTSANPVAIRELQELKKTIESNPELAVKFVKAEVDRHISNLRQGIPIPPIIKVLPW